MSTPSPDSTSSPSSPRRSESGSERPPESYRESGSRVVLITGAAQGVGLGIAEVLAEAGHRVALTDVDIRAAVRSAAAIDPHGERVMPLALDVADPAAWRLAVAETIGRFESLDALVNNAGISTRGDVEGTTLESWNRTLAVNLTGAWLGIQTAWPHLKASRGRIVNIGSTRASRPMRGMVPYVASKAALRGLTRQIAVEGLAHGVTCNMVSPGWVDTPGERIIQAGLGRPEFPEGVFNLTTPRDVGAAVAHILSPAGARINGIDWLVDAGLHVADDAGMVYLPASDTRRYS